MQGDSPLVPTGFGRVMNQLTKRLLAEGHELTLVAVNHPWSRHDPEMTKDYPFVIEGMLDKRGEPQGFQVITDILNTQEFDLVFCLNDQSIVFTIAKILQQFELQGRKMPRYVAYMPIDIDFMHGVEFPSSARVDHLICYTKHAEELAKKAYPIRNVTHMYHGSDLSEFAISRQMRKEARKKLKADKDTFVVINVNRNQWRKDLAVSMLGFMLFSHLNPEIKTKYYLHAASRDQGGNLNTQLNSAISVLKHFYPDFVYGENIMFPSAVGVPFEELAAFYRASDVYITTTIGEGWGLGITEAMSAKIPVIAPQNTSIKEILGENEERGYFIKSGATLDDWRIFYTANDMLRPMASPIDLADKLKHVYENREEANAKVEKAYEWCENNTWEKSLDHFSEVINGG